jgi:DnaK suppressor protein
MFRLELTRQRALLMKNASLSQIAEMAPEMYPDPVDQASTECEQEVALHARIRTFDKLRRIDRALELMRTSEYGRCRRCQQGIPHERLKVQPDALYCVPCLTLVEQKGMRNDDPGFTSRVLL